MSNSSPILSESEFILELKEMVANAHIDDVAQKLDLTPEMIRGTIKRKYRPGHKLAKALGYRLEIRKDFIPIENK